MLRTVDGHIRLAETKDLFQVIHAYWQGQPGLGLRPGLVANLWRRGLLGADIVRSIAASTGPDGQLVKAQGRGHDIMHTVIDTYIDVLQLPDNAELSQTELSQVVERWLAATRSTSLDDKTAQNAVLHWADYRALMLIDESGKADLEQVRQVARQVFSKPEMGFETLLAAGKTSSGDERNAHGAATAQARAKLKAQRKRGKLNRKRGRR